MNTMILHLDDQENERIIREVLNDIAQDLLLEIKYLQFKDSDLCSLKREDLVKLLLEKKIREEYSEQEDPTSKAILDLKDSEVAGLSREEIAQKIVTENDVTPINIVEVGDATIRSICNADEVIVETNQLFGAVFPDGEPEGLYNERGWITIATLPMSPQAIKDSMEIVATYLRIAA